MNGGRRSSSDAVLRPEWLDRVVANLQVTSGRLFAADRDEARAVLVEFVRTLPPAATPVESLVLRGLMIDFVRAGGAALHRRWCRTSARDCPFNPAAILDECWPSIDTSRQTFAHWIGRFFDELNRTHVPSPGERVGCLIRQEYAQSWSLARLAKRFHVTPATLRRSFTREFGMSIHDYQRRVRLIAALGAVRDSKIDALALQVGYRSKKNFYRAFTRLFGLTPQAYRRLSADRAGEIQHTAALKLQERGPTSFS